MREHARGSLESELAVLTGPVAEIILDITLDGEFTTVVSKELDGGFRLRFFPQKTIRPFVQVSARFRPESIQLDRLIDVLRTLLELPGDVPADVPQWEQRLSALILDQALRAVERKFRLQPNSEPFLDGRYDPTPGSEALCRRAMSLTSMEQPGAPSSADAGETAPVCLAEPLVLDLQMPFLAKDEWRERMMHVRGLDVHIDDFGDLSIHGPRNSLDATRAGVVKTGLVLAAACSPEAAALEGLGLTISHELRLSPLRARHALPPLLSAYGFDGAPLRWLAGCASTEPEVTVALSLKAPASIAAAWCAVPRERSAAFRLLFQQVSTRIQGVLRVWLPYVYFNDLAHYEEFDASSSLLVYQLSRPFFKRYGWDYTYDTLSPDSVAGAIRSAGNQPLRELLLATEDLLRRAGRETVAARYEPERARKITAKVKKSPRLFQSLLAAEACLVAEIIRLGIEAPALKHNPDETPRLLHRLVSQYVQAAEWKLKRLHGGIDSHPLASILLLEATLALAEAMGMPSRVQAVMRVCNGQSDRVFVNTPGCGL